MLDCTNCSENYDNKSHAPRILISCGHTICEACLQTLFKQKSIQCPECQTLNHFDSWQQFPKNLALLNTAVLQQSKLKNYDSSNNGSPPTTASVNEPPYGQTKLSSSSSPTSGIESSQSPGKHSIISKQDIGTAICDIHKKKIEAFCEQDQNLLCIDCILQSDQKYRQKEIVSISIAGQKEEEFLQNAYAYSIKTQEQLRQLQGKINHTRQELRDKTNSNKAQITSLFNDLRQILNK